MIHIIAIAGYVQTHLLGILLAILATYVVGFVWHGPLFGKQWMALNGLQEPKKEDVKFSMMLPGLSANFVMVFVQAAVMGRAFQILEMPSIAYAFIIAFILWLPFTALSIVNTYAWVGKSVRLMVLDAMYYFVSLCVVAAILYVTL